MSQLLSWLSLSGFLSHRMLWSFNSFLIIYSCAVLWIPNEAVAVVKIPLKHAYLTSVSSVLEYSRLESLKPGYNLHGMPGQGYYVEVAIGEPAQLVNILIDTGSSNFAVAAAMDANIETFFNASRSSTLQNVGTDINVVYTQGSWKGYLVNDVVRLLSFANLTSFNANIALITESSNFFINGSNWQGILGLAYSEIARPDKGVQPFFDSMVAQIGISDIFSIQLCGTVSSSAEDGQDSMAGTLILGGLDKSMYSGELVYVPIRREWYYEVVIVDIAVGGTSLGLDCKEYNFDKTIVDSGTTNLRLPTRVYSAVLMALKQQTKAPQPVPDSFWHGTDLLCWSHGGIPWSAFPSLTISLAVSANQSMSLVISPTQYLRRIGDFEQVKEGFIVRPSADCIRLSIASSDAGTVIGAVVMEGYYVVFDRQNKRLGFAETSCANSSTGSVHKSHVIGPVFRHGDTSDCTYVQQLNSDGAVTIVSYIMIAFCGICLTVAAIVLFHYKTFCQCRRRPAADDHNLLNEPVP